VETVKTTKHFLTARVSASSPQEVSYEIFLKCFLIKSKIHYFSLGGILVL